MPGAVPVTSSYALNNATLPFGLTIANGGLSAILANPYLREGLNIIAAPLRIKLWLKASI